MFAVVHILVTLHQRETLTPCVPNGVFVLTHHPRCPQHVGLSFKKQTLTRHVIAPVPASGARPFVPNRHVVVHVSCPPHTRCLWCWIVGHVAKRVRLTRHRAHGRARFSSTSSSVFSIVLLMRPLILATHPRAHSFFFEIKAFNDKSKGTAVIFRSGRAIMPLQSILRWRNDGEGACQSWSKPTPLGGVYSKIKLKTLIMDIQRWHNVFAS